MKDISNKTLIGLLVATLVVSLGSTIFTINLFNNSQLNIDLPKITGLLATNATYGNVTVNVDKIISLRFVDGSVNFGTGYVNTTGTTTNCSMDTVSGSPNVGCIDFDDETSGFVIENDGGTNATILMNTNTSGIDFIGVGDAGFAWNVTVNEAGSCYNTSKAVNSESTVSPNTSSGCGAGDTDATEACGTIFENVSVSPKVICPRLLNNLSNSLRIDVNITIPFDAPAGEKGAYINVTATADPLT